MGQRSFDGAGLRLPEVRVPGVGTLSRDELSSHATEDAAHPSLLLVYEALSAMGRDSRLRRTSALERLTQRLDAAAGPGWDEAATSSTLESALEGREQEDGTHE